MVKWVKPDMKTWFFILGLAALWFVNSKNIDPSQPLLILSIAFIAFPIILMGIFANPKTRKKVKGAYEKERKEIFKEIEGMRKKQRGTENIDKLIEIDEEILELRRELLAFRENIFEKRIVWTLIFFGFTILTIYLNLGQYIDTQNNIVMSLLFILGIYNISFMLKDLFGAFER